MAKRKEKTAKPPKPAKVRKKRTGLKFFVSLIIILAAAGAVFWFGWVQFELEEGQVAVVHTKSHGYGEEPLVSGEFNWLWQALLPTNLTLHIFEDEIRSVDIINEGTLPSGNLYAAMAGDDVDFGWSVHARITYRLDAGELPAMVADGLRSDGVESFYAEYEARAESALSRLVAAAPVEDAGDDIGRAIEDLERQLMDAIASIDDRVEVVETTVLDWQVPDLNLYAESRRLYLEFMALRQAVLSEVENQAVRREDIQGTRLDLLERYGRILDTYPVLLDLFALEGNPGAALLPPEILE